MLSWPYVINVLFNVLQNKYDLDHMAKTCPRVTKQMLFGEYGSNVLLVLREKCYFGHTL